MSVAAIEQFCIDVYILENWSGFKFQQASFIYFFFQLFFSDENTVSSNFTVFSHFPMIKSLYCPKFENHTKLSKKVKSAREIIKKMERKFITKGFVTNFFYSSVTRSVFGPKRKK
jgi:hypothetical protein